MRPTPRRQFLRQTAALLGVASAPSFFPGSVLGAQGAVPPSEKVTLGLIGSGGRGRDLLRGFLPLPQARLLAVCDPFVDRREQARQMGEDHGHQDCFATGDFREVLARKDIDAVIIATQDHWHALIAIAAAQAGKHLYCEKPLGVSYRESRAIRDAVRKAGVVFQTGTQQRSDRRFRQACELARNGYLGKVHTVEVASEGPNYKPSYQGSLDPQPAPKGLDWEMYLGPAPARPYNPGLHGWPDWYLIWDYCYGFIVNWGVHHLDIALWGCPSLGTEPFEVEANTVYRNEGFTDNISEWRSTFAYSSGLKMHYTDYWKQKPGVRFVGDEGWVYVDRPTLEAEPTSLLSVELKGSDQPLYASNHHGLDFLNSVRTGSDPVSNVEAGHQASYLGMVAEIAGRLRRKLRWDPVRESFQDAPEAATRRLDRPMRAPWKIG
jgi:predicted dehydrogenase